MITAALLACAITADNSSNVHPETMRHIIIGESGGDPYAVHVNRYQGPQPHPTNKEEAVAVASHFIATGYDVDLGESQINSRNLPSLGYTVEDAFDDCKNIAGGGTILTSFYRRAADKYGPGQAALGAAISAYNTGDFYRGYQNGYVARILGIPDMPVPDFHKEVSAVAAKAAPKPQPVPPSIAPFIAPTEIYSRVSFSVPVN